ncbi:hypothetical protein DPMN_106038 [Dreissena polymorpha]|uniref:Uncharacterized protein n=1 Tax=Dreissena polymorpha TaxID=45954 RepID=A0A9D4K4E0_DREPO|nr:hypothetical protein DPMN_106038 [Dreissena polymorpha]
MCAQMVCKVLINIPKLLSPFPPVKLSTQSMCNSSVESAKDISKSARLLKHYVFVVMLQIKTLNVL